MNRLHSHFAKQASQQTKRRLQRDIVADYRGDIISLIADYGAKLDDVIDAVRAQGEPVLEAGFKAEILKSIGTVKDIQAGRIKATSSKSSASGQNLAPTITPAHPLPQLHPTEPAMPIDEDDDDAFAVVRRPRH